MVIISVLLVNMAFILNIYIYGLLMGSNLFKVIAFYLILISNFTYDYMLSQIYCKSN
jgi:hypothetical protein